MLAVVVAYHRHAVISDVFGTARARQRALRARNKRARRT